MMKNLDKFYLKKREERIEILQKNGIINQEEAKLLLENELRLVKEADYMIENQLTTYELPYGLALNFLINDKHYVVPMVIEEPSVIAAASYGAATIQKAGGFTSLMEQKALIGEIAIENYNKAKIKNILKRKEELYHKAYTAYPSILNYGEGILDLRVEEKNTFLIVYITLDTGEAMGANMMNTILEALANEISEIVDGEVLMSILSNYATASLVKASFKIPPALLSKNDFSGEIVRDKIVSAYQLAKSDVYRVATHNKGIMNGIDAVVIASGNDWRAVNAAIYTYANQKPITKYYVEDECLVGEIIVPMPIGIVGGTMKLHPLAQLTKKILNYETSKELAQIIACVGLAQNFSALRALVTSGIQKGHMKLHRKSLLLANGAQEEEIEKLLQLLEKEKVVNQEVVKKTIKKSRK